jgi:hypothetical protein
MKFKSPLFSEASGSVGGATFSHNAAGLYVRARAVPVNPNTPRQQLTRQSLALAQATWKDTVSSTREAWASYAAATPLRDSLGRELYLTGLTMFLRTYVFYNINAVDPPEIAPAEPGLAQLTPPGVTWDETTQKVKVAFSNADLWATATGGFLSVFCSLPQSRSRNYWRGPYVRLGKVVGSATPPTSPQSFTPPAQILGDMRLFLRFRAADGDGRLSAESFGQVDATPLA